MRLLIAFALTAWILAAAEVPTKKVAARAPAATTANLQIPARAVNTGDGSYRYTDPQGKKWLYRKTPFGVARFEDKPVDATARTAALQKQLAEVKATEDGDTVRFERPGPFGIYKWQRKKTELDGMEQTVWDRERAVAAARQD